MERGMESQAKIAEKLSGHHRPGHHRVLSLPEARRREMEKKAYTNWVNHHLQKVHDHVEDLFTDFRSGVKLLKLIESLTGHKFTQEMRSMRMHHVSNVKKALDYLSEVKRMKLHGISVESIVDGKEKATLALVWKMILNFMFSSYAAQQEQTSHEGTLDIKVAKRELKQWAQRETEGYEEVYVTNFTSSWNDGMAFCAILDKHRPDLLDYHECHPSQPQDNLKKAFTAAMKLGMARLIDPDEDNIAENLTEDTIVMYVQMFRKTFGEVLPTHDSKVIQGDSASRQPHTDTNKQLEVTPEMSPESSQTEFADSGINSTDPLESVTVPKRSRSQKRVPFSVPDETELEKIHQKVNKLILQRSGTAEFRIIPIDKDKNKFKLLLGGSDKILWVRMMGNDVMVQIGRGWDRLEEYLDRHYPRKRGKPLASIVSKEDWKDGLNVSVTYTKESLNGSDLANDELSDHPTMQHHYGSFKSKTVSSLVPVQVPRSDSCPSKIPVMTHARHHTITTMPTTNSPVSRTLRPILTASQQPPKKASDVTPSTAKPVGYTKSLPSMPTRDFSHSGKLQTTSTATKISPTIVLGETSFLVELFSSVVKEMTPAIDDPNLATLREELVNILESNLFELGDKGIIQQLQEKVFKWKECVQQEQKQQEDKSRAALLEAKKSHGKSKEISKLTSDLQLAVQEKEAMKKELEEMEKMLLTKKEEMSFQNFVIESQITQIYELRRMLSKKADDTSQTEALSDSKEHECSLREQGLRIVTLESKLRAKEAQLVAAMKPKKKRCDDAAIQADYLAVAEFGLKGVEICGEKVFEVTAGSSEKYKWDSHGFQLAVPDGALPPGVTASVAVKSIVAGPFEFPENSVLISAIYWVFSAHVFSKKVTVHLQHCAIINTEEECSHFKIIIAKCSQDPPYEFAVKDGKFAPNSRIASMSVTQFSIFAVVGLKKCRPQFGYASIVFHKRLSHTVWEIAVVTVKALSALEEWFQQKYSDFTRSCMFEIVFEEDSECISIKICPVEKELWDISFMDSSNTSISKSKVDSFCMEQLIPPSCHFHAKWISHSDTVKDLEAVVKLPRKNSAPREIKFFMVVSPQPTQASTTTLDTLPNGPLDATHLREVLRYLKKQNVVSSWRMIGLELELTYDNLDVIGRDRDTVVDRVAAMLHQWLTSGRATKQALLDAVQEVK